MNNTDAPWYKDGLPFSCQGCGGCCRGPGGYVWLDDAEVQALADTLNLSLEEFGKQYLRRVGNRLALVDALSGDCIFLGADGRCRVYDARPVQCRTFPWWPEVVRSESSWAFEAERCPGINKGERHPVDCIREGLDKHS